jgi:metal transporter CNNM
MHLLLFKTGNVAVNACTSILCSHIAGGVIGFLVSTAVITLLGEILPQAVCSRHALRIGSAVVPLVKLLILLMWPITAPLAWLLDKMLGDEIGTIHSRTELRELLQIHVKHGAIDIETGRELACALQYKDMEVKNAMTYKKDVFMLASSDKLNYATVTNIFKAGYSR